MDIGDKLSYASNVVQQRLEIQAEFLNYRYDERIENWEDTLIQEFEL